MAIGEKTETKPLDYYLSLHYTLQIVPTGDGYFAKVEELPGCFAWTDSFEELEHEIEASKRNWIGQALEHGDYVPEPLMEEDFSGRILVRTSKGLHRDLVREAEREGVSLNQFIATSLARIVGNPSPL